MHSDAHIAHNQIFSAKHHSINGQDVLQKEHQQVMFTVNE